MIIIYLTAGLLNSEESKRGCSELLKKHFTSQVSHVSIIKWKILVQVATEIISKLSQKVYLFDMKPFKKLRIVETLLLRSRLVW